MTEFERERKASLASGLCMACDKVLPKSKTKRRVVCGHPECARYYQSLYAMQSHVMAKKARYMKRARRVRRNTNGRSINVA